MTDQGGNDRSGLPRTVWALGLVSLCMDISSEMIHALLPVFLVTVLGASTVMVGAIEGIGEATASISKLFSGWLSDRVGKRKLFAAIGYGLGAASKPLFAMAPSATWILAARFSDRVGKGIRGAPRDALIGDVVPAEKRGAAFGLRQSLDTTGAFLGPLAAIAIMSASGDNFRLVFWLAVIPGILAVVVLLSGVEEPRRPRAAQVVRAPVLDVRVVATMPRAFWVVVSIAAMMTLARFSEAFLILRAEDRGLGITFAPVILVIMNIAYAASAYPAGVLSDRLSPVGILASGFGVLVVSDITLALAQGVPGVVAGIVLWGLHMGITQGLLAALVTATAPAEVRGTAFGLFHLVTGIFVLLASLVAGSMWAFVGPSWTFWMGAAFSVAGLCGLWFARSMPGPGAESA